MGSKSGRLLGLLIHSHTGNSQGLGYANTSTTLELNIPPALRYGPPPLRDIAHRTATLAFLFTYSNSMPFASRFSHVHHTLVFRLLLVVMCNLPLETDRP